VRDRDGLIARVRQLRRRAEAAGTPSRDPEEPLRVLESRVEHLEQLVQGLQDSVHRESTRQAKKLADLEAQIQPATLSKALSDDARARGL
jgi:hypothetical protein